MPIIADVVGEKMNRVSAGWEDMQPLLDPLNNRQVPETEFPMLRCVDDYGYTYFNKFQAPFVIDELQRLEPHLPPGHKPHFDKFLRMAEQVRDGTHLYLRLQGD